VGRTFVWIKVCEGVGADERAGSVAFSLLTKLRRFVATLPSILILNNVGINEF